MLDWMFVCILFLAILLFVILVLIGDEIQIQWILGLIILDMVLWWSLAASNFEIEIPYEIYNATSGNIELHYHIFTSKSSPTLYYVFISPAVIMFIYLNYRVFDIILNWWKKVKSK